MTRLLTCAVLALALTGCADDGSIDTGRVTSAKAIAVQAIESANAIGFDPVQASPDRVARLAILCGVASSITTVIRPDEPALSDTGEALCAVIVAAAAKGAE